MKRSGLRLARATPERIELEGRRAREGPLLVAIGLAVLALVPLATPGALTSSRLLAAIALASLAAVVARAGAGLRQRVTIELKKSELSVRGRRHRLDTARCYVLCTSGSVSDPQPRVGYRVDLELETGETIPLLEQADPAVVVTDLRQLLEHVRLPVRSGWSLPAAAEPWRARQAAPKRRQPQPEIALRAAPLPSQRRAAMTVLGGAVFTLVAMSVMFAARLRRGDAITTLSWVLAIITVTILFAIGIFIATDHVFVRVAAGSLHVERRAFGYPRSAFELATSDLIDAHAIGPSNDDLRHVLVETTQGVYSITCAGDAAAQLADALRVNA